MAITLNLGEGIKPIEGGRSLLVPPSSIVVNPELRGRAGPVSPEKIQEMKASLLANGQLEDVLCNKIEDDKLQLVFGYTRHEAGLMLEAEDPAWRIRIRVIPKINEREAFEKNLVENLHRNDLNGVDHAVNIRRLIESYGRTFAEITAFYRKPDTWVRERYSLLGLSDEVRARVANGDLAVSSAFLLLKVPAVEHAAILAESTVPVEPEAPEDAAEESPESGNEPETTETAPIDPAATPDPELDALSDSIATAKKTLPKKAKGKPKAKAGKKAKSTTPIDRKKFNEAVGKRGVTTKRNASDLIGLLKQREDAISKALIDYLAGTITPEMLSASLDDAEKPIGKPVYNGPVKTLKRS